MEAITIITKLNKASMLSDRYMRKNGPKSYKRGQGALLAALFNNDGATQRDLCGIMHVNRKVLKDIVKKAERNGYVTIEKGEEPKTYSVKMTEAGAKLAAKHEAAENAAAEAMISCLTAEEAEQLNALCDKLVAGIRESGVHGKKRNGKKSCKRHCRKAHRR